MFKHYYLLPLLAAFFIGCGDKDSEDSGSEDTAPPADSGDDTAAAE